MLGMHGLKSANYAVQECDLLVCIGARFDDRVTGALATFAPHAKVVHLDIDPAEVGKRRQPDAPVVGCLKTALKGLTVSLQIEPWQHHCAELKAQHAWDYHPPTEHVYAPRLLRDLGRAGSLNTSPAMWVSIKCGWPSTTPSAAQSTISPVRASARWAMACRQPLASSWPIPMPGSST